MNLLKVAIRWMIRRDMAEVMNIERACFEFPLTEEEIIAFLRQRNGIGMVAEYDERVLGFMVYELHESRLNVLDFAVLPEFQRRGIGWQMVEKLVGKLSTGRREKITLLAVEDNLTAHLFFKAMGFEATNVLSEYYDSGEDAYVFRYRLPASVEAAT